jgi:outer membrane lipoprotein carrier protein
MIIVRWDIVKVDAFKSQKTYPGDRSKIDQQTSLLSLCLCGEKVVAISTGPVLFCLLRKNDLWYDAILEKNMATTGTSTNKPERDRTSARAWKKRSLAASVLLFVLGAAVCASPATAQSVEEAVQAVENHYRELGDLTATVVQKNHLKSLGKTQTFDAMLWIRKPGKLRLDYSNGQVILVDGKAALFYSRKSAQVIKKTFSDIEQMNVPVAFLLGAAHIRDDFEVRRPDPAAPRLLELSPKKPGAAMKKLVLRSDDAGRISSLDILDKTGNRTEIIFSNVQEGAGFDDKLFVFKAPKGTEIIEQ